MIAVNFRKEQLEAFLDCLKNEKSIPVTFYPAMDEHSWNKDYLALAGACLYFAWRKGPKSYATIPEIRNDEHLEAVEDTFDRDLIAAVEFAMQLATMLDQGEYEASFDDHVSAVISANGEPKVRPMRGFKS